MADGITLGYLGPDAWLYLRYLCGGQGRRLDSGAALAHARECAACTGALTGIAAGGAPAAVVAVTSPAATAVMTALLPEVA